MGSTCLQPLTGINAANKLAWLDVDASAWLDDDPEFTASGGVRGNDVVEVRETIALTLALSDGGTRFDFPHRGLRRPHAPPPST